jgi:malonyl-CoA O-methyltransferase
VSGEEWPRLERGAVARAFGAAAPRYDRYAALADAVRGELLARLSLLAFEPHTVLDLGAGTGHGARALRERWRAARIVALDLAPGMLRAARRQSSWRRRFDRVCADGARLPLRDGSVDLVFSNLMLPWAVDVDAQLKEIRRVLAPQGYASFSTLGPGTLAELSAAWREVDAGVHVHPFFDLHELGDALVRAGFADPVMDVDRYTLTYADFPALLEELRGTGSRNALQARARGLAGRRRRRALEQAYDRFRTADGRLPVSCEVLYGQAWCPGSTPPVRARRGEVVVPIGAIRRR